MSRVLAVLGQGLLPADTPLLRADDLGALRGDGVFETMHVRQGSPWLLEEHLARMAGSADRLDLDLPTSAELIDLARQVCENWPETEEGILRLVCTRGPEPGGPPTAYALLTPVGAALKAARTTGVSVLTLALGVASTARSGAPWLLGGAKHLSYAMNMACLRHATRSGYDDALWVSTDGYALECPTSTLLWRIDNRLLTTPLETGVLPSTTGRFLLDHASRLGLTSAEALVTPAELLSAEGVWLASSVRGVTEIRAIDDTLRPGSTITSGLQRLANYPL